MPQTNRTTGPPGINDDGSRFPGKCNHNRLLGKVRFFLGGGGRAGASEGRVISESEHQRGRAIPSFSAIQGEGHTFSRIFNGDFCDVIFHFSLTD